VPLTSLSIVFGMATETFVVQPQSVGQRVVPPIGTSASIFNAWARSGRGA
jgi:hypothetical protein